MQTAYGTKGTLGKIRMERVLGTTQTPVNLVQRCIRDRTVKIHPSRFCWTTQSLRNLQLWRIRNRNRTEWLSLFIKIPCLLQFSCGTATRTLRIQPLLGYQRKGSHWPEFQPVRAQTRAQTPTARTSSSDIWSSAIARSPANRSHCSSYPSSSNSIPLSFPLFVHGSVP